jgi:hypothetical protein
MNVLCEIPEDNELGFKEIHLVRPENPEIGVSNRGWKISWFPLPCMEPAEGQPSPLPSVEELNGSINFLLV